MKRELKDKIVIRNRDESVIAIVEVPHHTSFLVDICIAGYKPLRHGFIGTAEISTESPFGIKICLNKR